MTTSEIQRKRMEDPRLRERTSIAVKRTWTPERKQSHSLSVRKTVRKRKMRQWMKLYALKLEVNRLKRI